MMVRCVGALILICVVCGVAVSDSRESAQAVAARLDAMLAVRWNEEGVSPVELSSDAEFLRRVSLDLTGAVPHVSRVREFLADTSQHKRAKLIDELLRSPAHATHMATTWRNIMLPDGLSIEQQQSVAAMQNWFRRQFVRNMRYDRIVSDFLVATSARQSGPAAFYTAHELQPEKLAAATSRIFLGLQMECAQCHDHPVDDWTQEDFWGFAAFFARLENNGEGAMVLGIEDTTEGEVTIPDTQDVVLPQYPNRHKPDANEGGSRRVQLAIWMASRDNPYLPRAAVNRAWAHMFGRGLVNPVDDMGPQNPPSHPEVLDELSSHFANTGFDLRELYRVLANMRAYQLTSAKGETAAGGESSPRELFARMSIKRMTPDQLYDSLARSVLNRPAAMQNELLPFNQQRLAFVAKMQSRSQDMTEYDAGVLQALTMMNGFDTTQATGLQESGLLTALQAPWFDNGERVETIFLATVSRKPSQNQRRQFTQYVNEAAEGEQDKALSDILWALLNSGEFAVNH